MADGKIVIDTSLDGTGFEEGISKLGSIASTGLKAATAAITAVGTALLGCATYAIKVGSDFEAGMSQVEAISGASSQSVVTATGQMTDGLSALTEKAKEMGATTKFSATESSEALNYMAMAGWDAQAMYDGLAGIMNLAAASGEDLATTSDIVTDALTAFKMQASDSGHFADILATASASANTNVALMGETFKYVAPLCGTLGYSAEDAAIAIGLMANSGIKGSQAGTALKTALANMAAPTDKMAGAMEELGISMVDSAGNSKSLMEVMQNLRTSFADLSETEQTAYASMIFGKEAMSGMLAIINSSDEDFAKLTEAMYDCDGAAEAMAATMQDNLQGQLTILKSGVEGLGIAVYEKLQEPLKNLTIKGQEYITQLTDAFNEGGFEGLVAEIGNVLADAVSMIISATPTIVQSAVSVIKSFVSGIKQSIPEVSAAIVDVGKELTTGILDIVPDLFEAGVEIVINLAEGLADAFPDLIDSWNECVESITDIIVENIPAIVDAAFAIIEALVMGLISAVPVLLEAAITIMVTLVQYLIESIPMLLEAVVAIINGILQYITENLPTIIQAAITIITQLANSLIEMIPLLAQAVVSIITGIAQFVTANLPIIIQAAVDIVMQLMTSLIDSIPLLLDAVISIMDALLGFVVDNLPYIVESAVEIITQLCTTLVEMIPELIPVVVNLIMSLFNYVVQNLPTIIQAAIQIMMTLIDGIIDMIPELIPAVIQIIAQLFASIVENLPTIIQGAIEIIIALAGGLIQAIPQLVAKIPQIIVAIVEGFMNTDWGKVGKDIISGIGSGIKNAASSLVTAAVNAAKDALNAVKNWLGIKSPSRRFKNEVGAQLLPGVESGIEETEPELYDKMGDVSDKLVESFDYDPNAIDVSGLVGKMKAGVTAEVGQIATDVTVKARTGSGQVQGIQSEGMDYAAMAAAFILALKEAGIKVECDEREFGRLIAELMPT